MWILTEEMIIKVFILLCLLYVLLISTIRVIFINKNSWNKALIVTTAVNVMISLFLEIIKSVIFNPVLLEQYIKIQNIFIIILIGFSFVTIIHIFISIINYYRPRYYTVDYAKIIKKMNDTVMIYDYKGELIDSIIGSDLINSLAQSGFKNLAEVIPNSNEKISAKTIFELGGLLKIANPEEQASIDYWMNDINNKHEFEVNFHQNHFILTAIPIVYKQDIPIGYTVVIHNIQREKALNQEVMFQNSEMEKANQQLIEYLEKVELLEGEEIKLRLLKGIQQELIKGIEEAIANIDTILELENHVEVYQQVEQLSDKLRLVLKSIRKTVRSMTSF